MKYFINFCLLYVLIVLTGVQDGLFTLFDVNTLAVNYYAPLPFIGAVGVICVSLVISLMTGGHECLSSKNSSNSSRKS